MNAKVIAWGPYNNSISDYLDYPESYYFGARQGITVFSHFFHCVSNSQSEELAAFLTINPRDFSQHHFNNYQARQLVEFVDNNESEVFYLDQYLPNAAEEWEMLRQLILAGFQFYYDPGF